MFNHLSSNADTGMPRGPVGRESINDKGELQGEDIYLGCDLCPGLSGVGIITITPNTFQEPITRFWCPSRRSFFATKVMSNWIRSLRGV